MWSPWKERKIKRMSNLWKLHSEEQHDRLITAIAERSDIQKAAAETIDKVLITNQQSTRVRWNCLKILCDETESLDFDKLEKSLMGIGRKIEQIEIDKSLKNANLHRHTKRDKLDEFDRAMRLVAKHCTNAFKLTIYDSADLEIWDDSSIYGRNLLKRMLDLKIAVTKPISLCHYPGSKKRKKVNMFEKILKCVRGLTLLFVGQNIPLRFTKDLIELNGDSITRLELVTTQEQAILDKTYYKKYCPNLFYIVLHSTTHEPKNNHGVADITMSYGDKLEYGYLYNMDEEHCKKIAAACKKAIFQLDLDAEWLGLGLNCPQIIGPKLYSLIARKGDHDDRWRGSVEKCTNLRFLHLDLTDFDEVDVVIPSKMKYLKVLGLYNLHDELKNNTLDNLAKRTGELRELTVFCGRVQGKSFEAITKANPNLEYVEIDVDFDTFEESMSLNSSPSMELHDLVMKELQMILNGILRSLVVNTTKLKEINLFSGVVADDATWKPNFKPVFRLSELKDENMEREAKDTSNLIDRIVIRGAGVKVCGQSLYPSGFRKTSAIREDKRFFDEDQKPSSF